MSAEPEAASAAEAFWAFSVKLYASPGSSEIFHALQDEHGLDVNVILYCCWLGWSGRGRLSEAELAQARRRVGWWQNDVVARLRILRRQLKRAAAPGAHGVRRIVKDAEIAAERVEHDLLAHHAPPPRPLDPATRRADAAANLAAYAGDFRAPAYAPLLDRLAGC